MATSGPTQLPAFLSGDADFRTFCQGVAAALSAIGLVQAGDTGQINNVTVARPAVANTAAGYEIWRFADTLQASKPVFLKVEYGVGAATDRPSLWLTVGSQTNGAGTLSGQLGTRKQLAQNASKAAGNTLPLYASGAQSASDARASLFFSVDTGVNGQTGGFHVERTLDTAGNPTTDGIFTFLWGTSAGSPGLQLQTIPNTGAVPTAGTTGSALDVGMTGGAEVFGTDTASFPMMGILGKVTAQSLLVYRDADIGALGAASVVMYGATHTFMPLGVALRQAGLTPSGNTQTALAVRWE